MVWILYCKFTAWGKTLLICKINMAAANKIPATLYSEASMTTDIFNNKLLVLWSGAMPEGRNNRIIFEESFAFEGLTSLNK